MAASNQVINHVRLENTANIWSAAEMLYGRQSDIFRFQHHGRISQHDSDKVAPIEETTGTDQVTEETR